MQSFFACRGGYYPPEVISVTAEHPSIAEIKISILPVGVDALDDPRNIGVRTVLSSACHPERSRTFG